MAIFSKPDGCLSSLARLYEREKPILILIKHAVVLQKLTKARDILEARLADPATYDAGADKLTDLQRQHADITRAIEKAEEAWLEAQAELESPA